MLVIVDYGVGNLRSVQKALERVGAEAVVSGDPGALEAARGVVLPGVGAFGDGMAQLRARGLVEPVLRHVEAGKPLLGICLGMQLLFEDSEEMGRHAGLDLLPGRVVRFPEGDLKVPHIGWNQLEVREDPLTAGIAGGSYAYFVHSYYVAPAEAEDVLATTEYGIQFAAVVGRGRVWGAQFHPEKSQEVGLRLLQNFARLVGAL
jgi:imidazole glycerol-phosphate synthase subunit HisH